MSRLLEQLSEVENFLSTLASLNEISLCPAQSNTPLAFGFPGHRLKSIRTFGIPRDAWANSESTPGKFRGTLASRTPCVSTHASTLAILALSKCRVLPSVVKASEYGDSDRD
eukprot:3347486-Rhodomonas_salina.1